MFTSRSECASLLAAAQAGEGHTYPGQRLWQAREGRLRLLTPRGTAHELTWGKNLPDGSTLIDVLSPSISPNGKKVLFAGRKGGSDPGHFRLYEIGVDGQGLRQLTGGADDAGCTDLPPLRYAADGSLLPPEVRRAVDYDDVDPVSLPDGRIVFVSSRLPDLGRGHARRATHLWVMNADGSHKYPITANRNNDRWPFLLSSSYLAFSLWSRNTEVITADERDIRPYQPGEAWATRPTDSWLGALIEPTGDRFGALVKVPEPVWRPRPLFNGRIAFMTSPTYHASLPDRQDSEYPAWFQVRQAEGGLIQHVPSARPADSPLPRQKAGQLFRGPATDANGRRLSLATPSPCPEQGILLAGAPAEPGEKEPAPGRYGVYLADDDWRPGGETAVSAGEIGLRLLFDDPELVDAEPVAVYVRPLKGQWRDVPAPGKTGTLTLADGRPYQGPAGQVVNGGVFVPQNEREPGQETDRGEKPIFDAPPAGTIEHIRMYGSRRDRFDDLLHPRIPGSWELLARVPVTGSAGMLDTWLPAGLPAVLAGFTAEGKVARWTTGAQDSHGLAATFYAFAGDHYSSFRPGLHHFCLGCHPGHSGVGMRSHAERRP